MEEECFVRLKIRLRRPFVSLTPYKHLIATSESDDQDPKRKNLQIRILIDKDYYFLKLSMDSS